MAKKFTKKIIIIMTFMLLVTTASIAFSASQLQDGDLIAADTGEVYRLPGDLLRLIEDVRAGITGDILKYVEEKDDDGNVISKGITDPWGERQAQVKARQDKLKADPDIAAAIEAGNYDAAEARAKELLDDEDYEKEMEEEVKKAAKTFREAYVPPVAEQDLVFPGSYRLTLVSNPAAGGTLTGAGVYEIAAEATKEIAITAKANPGYKFVNWTKGVDVVSTDSDFTYTMSAKRTTLVANFELDKVDAFILTLEARPALGGKVTGAGAYEEGEDVEVKATANRGYKFVNWTKDGQEVSSSATFEYTMPGSDARLVANFVVDVEPKPVLEASLSDVNGNVNLVLPGVFNVEIGLDDLESVFGPLENKVFKLKVGDEFAVGRDEQEQPMHAFRLDQDKAYLGAVQGFTQEQLENATVVVEIVINEASLEELEGNVNLVLPGVFNVEIGLDKLESVFGSLEDKVFKLKVGDEFAVGRDEQEQPMHAFRLDQDKAYLGAVQGFTQEQLENALVVLD